MARDLNRHVDEEQLEGYALGRLSEDETAGCEEHLLVCGDCRERLERIEAFVSGVREAAPHLEEHRPRVTFPRSGWAWAGVTAVAAAALFVLARSGGAPSPSAPVAVVLETTRGESPPAVPAGTPVLLKPDLAGLPAAETYPLELVDSAGAVVWRGGAGGAQTSLTVPGLKAGAYFVRVYSPAKQLLREYTLRIGR